MALRFRKSVKLFPGVRLNFSGGGVSTTIGIPGASINLGKRGTHLNVGVPGSGLSYRTRLLPASELEKRSVSRFQPPPPNVTPPVAPQGLEGEIRSADIASLTSTGLGELKRLINEATIRRITLLKTVSEHKRQLSETKRKLQNAQRFIIRIFLKGRASRLSETAHKNTLNLEEARADLAACSINVDFALDHGTLDLFAAMVRIFEDLRRSAAIWDITSAVEIHRARERTLASEAITRTPVHLTLASSEIIDSAYQALKFPNVNGDDVCIYPGFVMTQSKSGDFSLIDVREFEVTVRATKFVEEETMPSDTEVVGQTWKKANKDGSPDKRFVGNFSIPIVKYGQLWFSSPSGLNEAYMFSNVIRAENFALAFSNYQRRLHELATTTRPVPPSDIRSQEIAEEEQGDDAADAAIVPAAPEARKPNMFFDWVGLILVVLVGAFSVSWALPFLKSLDLSNAVIASKPITPAPKPAIIRESPPIMREPPPPPRPQQRPQTAAPAPGPSEIGRPLNLSPSTTSAREVTFVQKPNVNLRSAPSSSAAVVAVTGKGKQFDVFARDGEWVQVGETSPTGWIHGALLGSNAP